MRTNCFCFLCHNFHITKKLKQKDLNLNALSEYSTLLNTRYAYSWPALFRVPPYPSMCHLVKASPPPPCSHCLLNNNTIVKFISFNYYYNFYEPFIVNASSTIVFICKIIVNVSYRFCWYICFTSVNYKLCSWTIVKIQ